jgi:hypothetical protein
VNDCVKGPENFTDGCADGVGGKRTGHFTAMVWKGVKEIGCATNKIGEVTICRYRSGDTLTSDTPHMDKAGGNYKNHVFPRSKSESECAGSAGAGDGANTTTKTEEPDETLKGNKGSGYRGMQTKTRSGRTCQNWDSQSPQKHKFHVQERSKFGLIKNYCRNPDGEATIWCYTTDPAKRWEFCDPIGAPKCWRRMPSGCNKRLSETATPKEWFIDPNVKTATKCTQRAAAFNRHCGKGDAQTHFGAKPQNL